MNAVIKAELTERDHDQELIWEALLIASGQSRMLATKDHLRALLGERSNLIAVLAQTKDGLVDACAALYGHDKSLAIAHIRDAQEQLQEAGFLELRDRDWVGKVTR